MFYYSEDFAELLMKTETAKIENFTNIEAIKDKLKKEVTSLRDELKNYKANLLEEQERIDEEKMQRLELEEQISDMRKRIKTEATEKAKLDSLANVGEESALEELLPQIDELATLTSVLENKVAKLEEHCSKPQTNSTVFEAVVELTGKLKQDFAEFKDKNEEMGEKVDATFRASQENTMKLQMVENQSHIQQEKVVNISICLVVSN